MIIAVLPAARAYSASTLRRLAGLLLGEPLGPDEIAALVLVVLALVLFAPAPRRCNPLSSTAPS